MDRQLMAQIGDFLSRRAAECDCTVREYVDHVFIALGLDAQPEDFKDVINDALRAAMEEAQRP